MNKLTIFSLSIMLLITSCTGLSNYNKNSKIFAFGDQAIGIVNHNNIDFYIVDGNGQWTLKPEFSFTIPSDNNGVFAFGDQAIGIVNHNNIDFYIVDGNGQWTLKSEFSFTIPN